MLWILETFETEEECWKYFQSVLEGKQVSVRLTDLEAKRLYIEAMRHGYLKIGALLSQRYKMDSLTHNLATSKHEYFQICLEISKRVVKPDFSIQNEIQGSASRTLAMIDCAMRSRHTPLMRVVAIPAVSVARVKALLDHGASVYRVTETGLTPLHFAAIRNNVPVAKLLLDYGAFVNQQVAATRETALHAAARYGGLEVSLLLLENGADVNLANVRGWTALHLTAKFGTSDLCVLLIQKGAVVDAETQDTGLTSLHLATLSHKPHLIRILLDAKADVNARTRAQGQTALHLAAIEGDVLAMNELLIGNADLNAQDDQGMTPLHAAASAGKPGIVSALVSVGADANIRDRNQKTPLDLATTPAIRIILKRGNKKSMMTRFKQLLRIKN